MAKYPLFEVDKDGNKKLVLKNLFKTDWQTILLILIVVFMVLSYKADIAKCNEAIEYPCDFCEKTNCCQVLPQFLSNFSEGTYDIGSLDVPG